MERYEDRWIPVVCHGPNNDWTALYIPLENRDEAERNLEYNRHRAPFSDEFKLRIVRARTTYTVIEDPE